MAFTLACHLRGALREFLRVALTLARHLRGALFTLTRHFYGALLAFANQFRGTLFALTMSRSDLCLNGDQPLIDFLTGNSTSMRDMEIECGFVFGKHLVRRTRLRHIGN